MGYLNVVVDRSMSCVRLPVVLAADLLSHCSSPDGPCKVRHRFSLVAVTGRLSLTHQYATMGGSCDVDTAMKRLLLQPHLAVHVRICLRFLVPGCHVLIAKK